MYKNKTQRRSRKSSLTWCNRGIWEVQRRKGKEHKNIYKNTQGRKYTQYFFFLIEQEGLFFQRFIPSGKPNRKFTHPLQSSLSSLSRSLPLSCSLAIFHRTQTKPYFAIPELSLHFDFFSNFLCVSFSAAISFHSLNSLWGCLRETHCSG